MLPLIDPFPPWGRCSTIFFILVSTETKCFAQHLSTDNLTFVAGLRGRPVPAPSSEPGQKKARRPLGGGIDKKTEVIPMYATRAFEKGTMIVCCFL